MPRKAHPFRRQAVDVWCADLRLAVATEFPPAEVIGQNEHYIGPAFSLRSPHLLNETSQRNHRESHPKDRRFLHPVRMGGMIPGSRETCLNPGAEGAGKYSHLQSVEEQGS